MFEVRFVSDIAEIGQVQWQRLVGNDSPFLRYEFLSALEAHDCVGKRQGWLPFHLVLKEEHQPELLALMPLYLKYNSYGELVFDWSWADAYERAGRQYYPKLVSAIPYTPVTGPRYFQARDDRKITETIIRALIQVTAEKQLSSMHCLFLPADQVEQFESYGFVTRVDCQFHWQNLQYESFGAFLASLSSQKRKNIKRERRRVEEQGITFQILRGDQIDTDLWPLIHTLYQKTFLEKGGYATFSEMFFRSISQTMGDQLLVILAIYRGEYVACAICYQNQETLFGRHWGCFQQFNSLHFEVCYYQGIEYAITQQLTRFEPGAQGEHKISRGFLPTPTRSCHWIREADFREVIARYTRQEQSYMADYIDEMQMHTPFKNQ